MRKNQIRRRVQFTLRQQFILVLGFSMVLGFGSVHRKWIQTRHDAIDWVQAQARWSIANASNRTRLPWGLRLLGERFAVDFIKVRDEHIRPADSYTVSELQRLFPEAAVHVTSLDSDMAHSHSR